MLVSIFYQHVTRKNLKTVCVKFSGKIECMLVLLLAYVIVHHLKSVCQTQRNT